MKVLQCKDRHQNALVRLSNAVGTGDLHDNEYIIIAIDRPSKVTHQRVDRSMSIASDFSPEVTHRLLKELAEQTK